MQKLDIKEVESVVMTQIKPQRFTEGLARINKNNHYEVTSFGHAIDVNSDIIPAEAIFHGSGSSEVHLWHVLGGMRHLLKVRIR